jgi:hypothetical protein
MQRSPRPSDRSVYAPQAAPRYAVAYRLAGDIGSRMPDCVVMSVQSPAAPQGGRLRLASHCGPRDCTSLGPNGIPGGETA